MVGEGGEGDAEGNRRRRRRRRRKSVRGRKKEERKFDGNCFFCRVFPPFFSSIFAPVEKRGGKGDLIPIRKALVNLLQQKERRGERKPRKDFFFIFPPSKEWKRKSV